MYLGIRMKASPVVMIKGTRVFLPSGDLDRTRVTEMVSLGLRRLTGTRDAGESVARLFSRDDRVAVKVNTIGGREISTRPDLSLALAEVLSNGGQPAKNIIIWDRTNRELRQAGYKLSDRPSDLKIMATDTSGAGYETEIFSHRNIGSLFSTIQTQFATASVSLAILKDHGLAGVTAGMKNYFGAIHNPNKYHDSHCDPFIAELFESQPIKDKHRFSLLDALLVQYHRGPSFHTQWAEPSGTLIFSFDPVAADAVGWRMIEGFRAKKGLPSLQEEGREPVYLKTAEAMGLGKAALESIEVVQDEI
jgi:uncharacterized protein (DUF362 family)